MTIYEIVCKNNIELLAEADELTEEQKTALSTTVKDSTSADHGITIELIQKWLLGINIVVFLKIGNGML